MTNIYSTALSSWHRLQPFRDERNRCKRYVYGDQWQDKINVNGHTITEYEFILQQGQVPLKNNILRRILRNVVGLYRSQYKVPTLSKRDFNVNSSTIKAINQARRKWFAENFMEELAPRLLEEFLISGLAAVKVQDGKIIPVTPDNFFFHSDGYDPRGWNLDLVGEVHQVSYGNLLTQFCKTAADCRKIESLYGSKSNSATCQVTEVWYKDTRVTGIVHDTRNASITLHAMGDLLASPQNHIKDHEVSSIVETSWHHVWFANDGSLLRDDGLSETQPYVFKAYPFLDGEIHSYISDIIDQQRYVNRLITLYDFIMKASAKGVLLFPDESLPAGMDLQDVADEWSRFNGVITYHAKPGVPMPTQVSGNAANIGITDLLKIELQLLEDISGVSPTLQGKLETNATSGTLFARQNEAAQTSLLDVIRSFTDFLSTVASLSPSEL